MRILKACLSEFTEREYERTLSMMSDDRKEAIARYRSEKDRRRSVLGEMLARKGISEASGIAESDIILSRTDAGKPYAVNSSLYFSISHSKNMVVCAVNDSEIGVDVEMIRDIDMRITKFACTEKDLEYVLGKAYRDSELPEKADEETVMRFFTLWTAKEAYVKYHGTGISYLKHTSLTDILPKCQFFREGEYMIAVYSD